jgi:hypothetical protein
LMSVGSLYKLHADQQQKPYTIWAIHIVCIFVWYTKFFQKLPLYASIPNAQSLKCLWKVIETLSYFKF